MEKTATMGPEKWLYDRKKPPPPTVYMLDIIDKYIVYNITFGRKVNEQLTLDQTKLT